MTTITIDIPDNTTAEIIALLETRGIKIRESKLSKLDSLTKEDYQKNFAEYAKTGKNNVLKHL